MKKQLKSRKQKYIFRTILVLGIIALMSQILIDLRLLRRPDHDTTLAQLISHAVENLYKPAAVDSKTGLSYIPELKLMLPIADTNAAQIRYVYHDYPGDSVISITTNGLLSTGETRLLTAPQDESLLKRSPDAIFNVVPSLQACARGLQLYTQPQTTSAGTYLALTLHLKDGRTYYGYIEHACHQNTDILVTTVKQAQSY